MAPTLLPGELVFVSSRVYRFRLPRQGEIVAARPESLGGKALIKRLVGVPYQQVRLGDGEFFLLGDHAEHSMDSRIFGPVSRRELIGPVRLRLWPLRFF